MHQPQQTVFIAILLSILLGCAAAPKEVYRGYSGIEPNEGKLATLDVTGASEVVIDDMYYVNRGKYGTVQLPAGAHKIKWVGSFVVSVLIEPSGHAAFNIISDVNLEAGHVYKLSTDRTTGPSYRVYFWIEDTTTRKIIWGKKKP